MNFYKHHLGDYDGATAHLSWVEDMAYTRLLRTYYRREAPIPADMAVTCRLVRATRPAEKAAVQTVLAEFFELESDGWHNKRADEEIAAYQQQAATNRRIAQARTGKRNDHDSSDDSSTIGTPNHKPLAKNQEPEKTKSKAEAPRGTRLAADWALPKAWGEWALKEQPTWTPEHVRKVAEVFRDHWIAQSGQRGVKLEWEATWRNWVRREGALKVNGSGGGTPWWSSEAGVLAKGKEFGLSPRPGEQMTDFRGRINAAMGAS